MARRIVVVRRPVYGEYVADSTSVAKTFGPWDVYEAERWAIEMNSRNTPFYYEALYETSTGHRISIGGV